MEDKINVTLRPVEVEDAEIAFQDLSNPDFVKWMYMTPRESVEQIEEYYQHIIPRMKTREEYVFAILHKGKFSGCVGLHKIDYKRGEAEIGLWVSQQKWKLGLGENAARLAIGN